MCWECSLRMYPQKGNGIFLVSYDSRFIEPLYFIQKWSLWYGPEALQCSEVVGQKKGAKHKLNCKEYILKWKMKEKNTLTNWYKDRTSDLVPPWDCCNVCSDNRYCYNTFHKIQLKRGSHHCTVFVFVCFFFLSLTRDTSWRTEYTPKLCSGPQHL